MPELVRFRTTIFQLSIWCKDITERQNTFYEMLRKKDGKIFDYKIKFSPQLDLIEPAVYNGIVLNEQFEHYPISLSHFDLTAPLFFENMQYQIELIFFDEAVENVWLTHKLNELNENFRFSPKQNINNSFLPARFNGVINTKNDVGWMSLPLHYTLDDRNESLTISFEILPTKIDLHHDLPMMYQHIDNTYPLWRFNIAAKTEQNASKRERGDFPLLWLANFTELREKFEAGLKVIASSPHSRLQKKTNFSKPERMKGRINNKLLEQIKEDFANTTYTNYYKIDKKFLSVDTPENRYIKMIIGVCKSKLISIYNSLVLENDKRSEERLSQEFLDEIYNWQAPLLKMERQSFFKDVGDFNGLVKESLVLQQKTGYSTVYKVWQELHYYLNAFSSQSLISMRSVSEIYEIWCFLQLRRILVEELAFIEIRSHKEFIINGFLERQLKDGMAGAFEFTRSDGVKVKLVHEPIFKENSSNIRSYVVNQKPDILLEVNFPNGKKCIWIFDAKYRIKTQKDRFVADQCNEADCVPDDAINQMHRYRDALIQINNGVLESKSRPVFGAFALYPGYFDQESDSNPYASAIDEVGIGAFALLPSNQSRFGHQWLSAYLCKHIGILNESPHSIISLNKIYLDEATRIPFHGMEQSLFHDLVMTISIIDNSKDVSFKKLLENPTIYALTLDSKVYTFDRHIIKELRFLALAFASESRGDEISKIWPIKSVSLNSYTKTNNSYDESLSYYYKFELGSPLILHSSISGVPNINITDSIRFTTLSKLEEVMKFSDILSVY
ncbi:DUF2357 domain-containing protein [Acinetobacter sp. 11367]|uniref:DUF2357 domain-containing protein n=1 Tax=Acinetobacter sp. 11367 TaxID=3058486 RepID=UPI0028133B52|nr:DUF2357 domain-containing protein [Acinetobacter sp. 11367]MDR0000503.1 DUF2357 domain-containing protein [Acinetobacter sp. 11367]